MKENNAVPPEQKPYRGKLMTFKEAANYIRMGHTCFYDCVRDGLFTPFRPPRGKRLIDSADLDDWLRVSKVPADTVPGKHTGGPMKT